MALLEETSSSLDLDHDKGMLEMAARELSMLRPLIFKFRNGMGNTVSAVTHIKREDARWQRAFRNKRCWCPTEHSLDEPSVSATKSNPQVWRSPRGRCFIEPQKEIFEDKVCDCSIRCHIRLHFSSETPASRARLDTQADIRRL